MKNSMNRQLMCIAAFAAQAMIFSYVVAKSPTLIPVVLTLVVLQMVATHIGDAFDVFGQKNLIQTYERAIDDLHKQIREALDSNGRILETNQLIVDAHSRELQALDHLAQLGDIESLRATLSRLLQRDLL